jgi:hypothetical protein
VRRKKSFAGQEWASRDANVAMVFVTLVAAGFLFSPVFLYAACAYAVVVLAVVGVRLMLRHRREQANADAPFWADRIKDPEPPEPG